MASSVVLSANGSSSWLKIAKDQVFEVVCATWGGATATVELRVSPDGEVHTAQKDGTDFAPTSNAHAVAECDCEIRITSSNVANPITLRRGVV